MPKPKAMQGRVAFITGGAGGIGSASADRLLREGCNVVLADIDRTRWTRWWPASARNTAATWCAACRWT